LNEDFTNWQEWLVPRIEVEAEAVLRELKRTALEKLSYEHAARRAFEANLFKRWGRALNLLEVAMYVALEAGQMYNEEHRPTAAKETDCQFEVLTRLHARACALASEIYTLLLGGHATGAMARWRALHEVTVVALFIRRHGNATAERYLLHEIVESKRGKDDYEACYVRLGYDPLDMQLTEELESEYRALLHRFGREFGSQYGWAAEVSGVARPTFGGIEQAVGLDHMRAHYRMSSHGIHANPKGIMWNIGLLKGDRVLLAGPSNAGLADPGDCTLISLYQCTVALLTLRPTEDALVSLKVLDRIAKEGGEAFHAIHHEQLSEEGLQEND